MNVLVVIEIEAEADEVALAPLEWVLERRGRTDRLTVALAGPTMGRPAQDLARRIERRLAEWGGISSLRKAPGDPAREILRLLGHEPFDELIAAGGSRTPAGKIRPGPLAERLLLNAPVTLTFVR